MLTSPLRFSRHLGLAGLVRPNPIRFGQEGDIATQESTALFDLYLIWVVRDLPAPLLYIFDSFDGGSPPTCLSLTELDFYGEWVSGCDAIYTSYLIPSSLIGTLQRLWVMCVRLVMLVELCVVQTVEEEERDVRNGT